MRKYFILKLIFWVNTILVLSDYTWYINPNNILKNDTCPTHVHMIVTNYDSIVLPL